jgi:hypothetical protein
MQPQSPPSNPLTLLEINELNFDIVRQYLAQSPGRFPNFESLVKCRNEQDAAEAARILGGVRAKSDGQSIFGEIDLRGSSLFVTLTYPKEIARGFKISALSGQVLEFQDDVAFVAIKNGMHSGRGFCFFRGSVSSHAMPQGAHVKSLHDAVLAHFGMDVTPAGTSKEAAA